MSTVILELGMRNLRNQTRKIIWLRGNNGEFKSLIAANFENGIGLVYTANSPTGLQLVANIIQSTIGGVHPLARFNKVN